MDTTVKVTQNPRGSGRQKLMLVCECGDYLMANDIMMVLGALRFAPSCDLMGWHGPFEIKITTFESHLRLRLWPVFHPKEFFRITVNIRSRNESNLLTRIINRLTGDQS